MLSPTMLPESNSPSFPISTNLQEAGGMLVASSMEGIISVSFPTVISQSWERRLKSRLVNFTWKFLKMYTLPTFYKMICLAFHYLLFLYLCYLNCGMKLVHKIVVGSQSNLSALVNDVDVEQLPIPFGIGPCPHVALSCTTSSNGATTITEQN